MRVFNAEGLTIQRMEKAFEFFASWAEEQEANKEDKKSFLAWQVSGAEYINAAPYSCPSSPEK